MNKQKDFISLEQALEQFFSAPVPRKEFLENLEQSLYAEPKMRIHPFSKLPRQISFRPVYAFLGVSVILIITFLAVGPANVFAALQGLIRYIPGFGLVDEKTPLRVLAEPVSVTREGVTVIVKQAILSTEQMSITYIVKGIPFEARPMGTISDRGNLCVPVSEIRLPDGSRLEQQGGGPGGYDTGNNYQYIVKFPPIRAQDNQVTWFLSCLPDTVTGKAPTNWEIPLHFVPAPQDLPVFSVDIITSSPETIKSSFPTQATADIVKTAEPKTDSQNPLALDKVVETEDGYIFIGQFRQVLPAQVTNIEPQILDGNGLLQGYTIPGDIYIETTDQAIRWAYQIHNKNITWPVTIRFEFAQVYCTDPQAKLTFDAGPNPQAGQVWEINQDYAIGPCKFHIDFVKRISKGYVIRLTGIQNANAFQISPWIEGPMFSGGSIQYPDHLDFSMTYDHAQVPPKGLITLYLSAYGPLLGPWQVQWQPNK